MTERDTLYLDNLLLNLSKQIGNIKDLVIDYSKNLTSITRSYGLLRTSGKKWLSSVNMLPLLKMQLKSIKRHGGLFLSTYNKISSTMVALGKNMSTLGVDFESMTSNIKDIDDLLQNIKLTMSSMSDKKALASILKLYKLLELQRNMLYDMNLLQTSLDLKLKKPMLKMDIFGLKLLFAKDKFGDMLLTVNSLGFLIPGLTKLIGNINFTNIFLDLKKTTSLTVMNMSGAFNSMLKDGKKSFKGIFSIVGKGFAGLAKGIGKIFKYLFAGIALGAIGMIGAMIMTGINRNLLLQKQYMSTQLSAGALSGDGSKFGSIYSTLGGLLGGLKATLIYSTMRSLKDVTIPTAKAVQTMLRNFGVSASTTSAMLQNMRYIQGMSLSSSNSMAKFVGNVAVALKIQPLKMMSLLANMSSDVSLYMGRNVNHLKQSLIYAKKLNMTMDDMASTAKGLDDTQKVILTSLKIQTLTGKKLDVSLVLRLHNMGKSTLAIAMLYDSYQSLILNGNRHVMLLMGLMFNIEPNTIRTAALTIKKSGGTFGDALNQAKILALKGVGDKGTKAAALLTQMLATKRKLSNVIADSTKGLFDYINNNLPDILEMIESLTTSFTKLITDGLDWFKKPLNSLSVKSFFSSLGSSLLLIGKALLDINKATGGKGILYAIIGVVSIGILKPLIKSISVLVSLIKKIKLIKIPNITLPKGIVSRFTGVKSGMVKSISKTGQTLWRSALTGSKFIKAPISAIGRWFTGVKSGMVKSISKTGQTLWRSALTGKFIKAPISAIGRFTLMISKTFPVFGKFISTIKFIGRFLGPLIVIMGVFKTYDNIIKRLKLSTTTSLPKLINTAISGMILGILKTLALLIPFVGTKISKKISKLFDNDIIVDSMQKVTLKLAKLLLDGFKGVWNGIKYFIGGTTSFLISVLRSIPVIGDTDMVKGLVKFSDKMLGGEGKSGYSINSKGNIVLAKPIQLKKIWKSTNLLFNAVPNQKTESSSTSSTGVNYPPVNVTLNIDSRKLAEILVSNA